MALYIKNVFRAYKDQDFMKTCLQQRFLTNTNTLNLPAKRIEHFKSKKYFNERNNYSKPSGYNYNSVMQFYHLAINIFNSVGFTNIENRNYAKGRKEPPTDFDEHISSVQDVYVKERMFQEINRLRRKGALKDLPVKTPEAVATKDEK